MRFDFRRRTAVLGVLGIVSTASCAQLSGLDPLAKVQCVDSCDGGKNVPDAAQNDAGTFDASVVDAGIGADGNDFDSSQAPSDDGASDSPSDDGSSERTMEGPVDSSPEDAGRPGDAGSDASTGAGDAQREAGSSKCGSGILTPATAVASSVTSPNVAAFAIDGLLTTRWESLWADPQTIDADFGAPVFIGEVDVLWEAACARDYDLEVSMDGATWTTIPNGTISNNRLAANVAANPPTPPMDWSNAVVTGPLSAVGRYLRVHATVRCSRYGYSMWEMRALGDRDASCVP